MNYLQIIFFPYAALKMCSNAHLLYVNSAFARVFALPKKKILIAQNPFTSNPSVSSEFFMVSY